MLLSRQDVEELYRTYGSLVLRRARRILGSEEQARDAMQDVFVKVIKSYDAFRGQASPASWLYRITTNLCINRIRDASRQRSILKAGHNPNPPLFLSIADQRIDLFRALEHVPPQLSEVALYYYGDEMDQQEIANLLGMARRTVSYRLEQFRQEAQKILRLTEPLLEKEATKP